MLKFLTAATFAIWGETDTENRFIRWEHPDLPQPVTLLLTKPEIDGLIHLLQAELPRESYTSRQTVQ